MTRNDRIWHKHLSKDCNSYPGLTRIYIRKTEMRKEPKYTAHRDEGKRHYHGTAQKFIAWAWRCFTCGLIVIDPCKCPKCESDNIEELRSTWKYSYDKIYDSKTKQYRWLCNQCKKIWVPKISKDKNGVFTLT